MGDILQAIEKAMQEYIRLCRKYNEPIHMIEINKEFFPDCYSEHAGQLKARERSEQEAVRKRNPA